MSDPVQLSYTVAAPWLQNDLWLLNEEDFSWNCYTGTLSFDGHYNLCKTGYQSISSTGTLSWKMFHWLGLNDKVPRQLSYGVVVPELYEKKIVYNDSTRKTSRIATLISYWFMPNQTTEMNYAWFNPTGLRIELTYQLSKFSFSRHFHVLLSW